MSEPAALPFLSDAEIASLCDGLQLPAAQCRYLAKLGLLVNRKPNGRPLVARSEFERWKNPPPPVQESVMPTPVPVPWEQTPLGRAQALWREAKAEQQARDAAWMEQHKPTRDEALQLARARDRLFEVRQAALVRFHAGKRRTAKLQRTPAWADMEAILAVYLEARRLTVETGTPHHVDHFYPLQGRLVSGLHVANNLQILTGSENSKKHNCFEIEP